MDQLINMMNFLESVYDFSKDFFKKMEENIKSELETYKIE